MAQQKRLPKDFNAQNPNDIEITDPVGAALNAEGKPIDREYPKHLHKDAGVGNPYEYVVVTNAAEEKAKRAQGWSNAHELDAERLAAADDADCDDAPAKAPKNVAAKKPRNPKPKPVDDAPAQ